MRTKHTTSRIHPRAVEAAAVAFVALAVGALTYVLLPSEPWRWTLSAFTTFTVVNLGIAFMASRQLARNLARRQRVEVVVYRDPHDVSEVTVFLDGHRVDVARMHEVDPGANSPQEWLEMGAKAANDPGRSQAWADQVTACYTSTVPLLEYDEDDDSDSDSDDNEERTS